MSLSDVLTAAGDGGLPLERVLVGTVPGVVPSGPSGTWVLFPGADGASVLGGMDRGAFAPYGRYEDDDATLNALRHVLTAPVEDVRAPVDELARDARALAQRLRGQTELTAADVPAGAGLDQIGPVSGFHLFLLGTPFPERSLPPTDLALPRRGWLLREPLPATCRVSTVSPWFGQPGGGVMVTLDRPARWYDDTSRLDAFAVA